MNLLAALALAFAAQVPPSAAEYAGYTGMHRAAAANDLVMLKAQFDTTYYDQAPRNFTVFASMDGVTWENKLNPIGIGTWAPGHRLVRIGLKGREVSTAQRAASRALANSTKNPSPVVLMT